MNHHGEHQATAEHPPLPGLRGTGLTWPAIVGLDLSMTATGLALFDVDGFGGVEGHVHLERIDSKPLQSGVDAKGKKMATWGDRLVRLDVIVLNIGERIPEGSLVFLEAPSYGSTGSGTFDRSGLWWMMFADLVQRGGCRVVPVAPSQRMLYATGKGGGKDAGKDAVIAAVTRRYPDLDVRDNNVADAVVLMAMARRAALVPMEDSIPAANLKAMDKLEAL